MTLVTEPFRVVAETMFRSLGHAEQPRIVLPAKIEFMTNDDWRQMAEEIAKSMDERMTEQRANETREGATSPRGERSR